MQRFENVYVRVFSRSTQLVGSNFVIVFFAEQIVRRLNFVDRLRQELRFKNRIPIGLFLGFSDCFIGFVGLFRLVGRF